MGEKLGYLPYPKGFSTTVCHFAQEPEQWSSSAIIPPIFTSINYSLPRFTIEGENYVVSPWGNPTRDVLEKLLARLENGKYGACFASGSAATNTCLSLLNQNDHLICSEDIYGGTRKQLLKIATRYGIETSFVDDEPECFERAIKSNTKMIWIESPTNPSLVVIDIQAVAAIAKRHNILLVVDNTFLSSFLQRPLDFGADISLQSVSKYLNGHSDIIMGALVTNNEKLFEEIRNLQKCIGNSPSPFDCSQVLRGLKTLPVRIKKQAKNAIKLAEFLEKHPKIEKVIHPGLPSHPKHELMKKQTSGPSGMVTFYVKGNAEKTRDFMSSLRVVACAGSLGGFNTVVELPTKISHFSVAPEVKEKLNYTESMIRMSVGLEDIEDLISDMDNALLVV